MFDRSGVAVIAEIGVNHNGNVDLALSSIDAAKESGADIVKFQTFRSDLGISKLAPVADYQKKNTKNQIKTQLELVRGLELGPEQFVEIADHCKNLQIEFMSTAFDLPSLELVLSLGVNRLKIPSGDIDNVPLLNRISESDLSVILSTGMADLEEIRFATSIIDPFGDKDIVILQCTSEYPCPNNEVHLHVLETLREEFGKRVGLSDHTDSKIVPALAVAAGACVIEKHFTLSRSLSGPDHKASLEPREFKQMVENIRLAEESLGTSKKQVSNSEVNNKSKVRKSIVASKTILKGEVFSVDNITMKRPANGKPGKCWFDVVGRIAERAYLEDDLILL